MTSEISCNPQFIGDHLPLSVAIREGHEEMVELLLKHGADPNVDNYRDISPLVHAAEKGNSNIIKLLLAYGADINLVPVNGSVTKSALHCAVVRENLDVVQLLLDNIMIDVNTVIANKMIALHSGALFIDDNFNVVQHLLDAGADANAVNGYGHSALDISCLKCSTEIESMILKHIVKLSAANFYVSKKNLAEVTDKVFEELRIQCCEEVQKMKKTYITGSNFTFYDVLCMDQHSLAVRLTHIKPKIIINLNTESIFPLYGGMLNYRLKKELRRKKLLLKVKSRIYSIFDKMELPSTCTREVF
ncbi:transient receptor potential channel pyrexia-like [Microplitis mediator]|uniref:transient receptor potential channel pyrexia-like n=1 Tax=Microplitis mediator TaxID=375433 RepID=UPI002554478A|nr:transient receptor potential channel pyrexia-like [Microplitis mediator]